VIENLALGSPTKRSRAKARNTLNLILKHINSPPETLSARAHRAGLSLSASRSASHDRPPIFWRAHGRAKELHPEEQAAVDGRTDC